MRKMSLLALVLVILGVLACIGDASRVLEYKPLSGEESKAITEEEKTIANGTNFADWGDNEVTLTVNEQPCHLSFNPPLHTISCYFPKYVNRAIYERLAEVLDTRPLPGSLIGVHVNVDACHILSFDLTELCRNDSDQESRLPVVRKFSLTLNRTQTTIRRVLTGLLTVMLLIVLVAIAVVLSSIDQ